MLSHPAQGRDFFTQLIDMINEMNDNNSEKLRGKTNGVKTTGFEMKISREKRLN